MKIYSAEQMQQADLATFERLELSSRAVMEVAGRSVASIVSKEYGAELAKGVYIFTGKGNNGGDGYVAARALSALGAEVKVFSICETDELKGDAIQAANSWLKSGGYLRVLPENSEERERLLADASLAGVLIDALYGTGFKGAPREPSKSAIELVNEASMRGTVPVVSVDVPSGIDASSGAVSGVCIGARMTVCLQALKTGNVLFPASPYGGMFT